MLITLEVKAGSPTCCEPGRTVPGFLCYLNILCDNLVGEESSPLGRKMWNMYTMEYYSARTKEWSNAIFSNMDGLGDCHTK